MSTNNALHPIFVTTVRESGYGGPTVRRYENIMVYLSDLSAMIEPPFFYDESYESCYNEHNMSFVAGDDYGNAMVFTNIDRQDFGDILKLVKLKTEDN